MKIMDYLGFKARIMKAQRLIGSGVYGLPPGSPIEVFAVDEFEAPLEHWIKGAGNYVVPVDSDWGLWFDWTMNDKMNTAVLPSIKGMNPITGQRTNGFSLERYETKCPIHDEVFKEGMLCEKCGFKWPYQNYITHPNTLWWDGFRTDDGKVRQFFFTEELSKSIPELVIGKEDTVPAFGFAFFRPKVTRETKTSGGIICSGGGTICPPLYDVHTYYSNSTINCCSVSESDLQAAQGVTGVQGITEDPVQCAASASYETLGMKQKRSKMTIRSSGNIVPNLAQPHLAPSCQRTPCPTKKLDLYGSLFDVDQERSVKKRTSEVGVGAGAEILQGLQIDTLKVTDWEEKPSSVMRLYFVFVEQFEEIRAKGMKNLSGVPEGYLAGLPVG